MNLLTVQAVIGIFAFSLFKCEQTESVLPTDSSNSKDCQSIIVDEKLYDSAPEDEYNIEKGCVDLIIR